MCSFSEIFKIRVRGRRRIPKFILMAHDIPLKIGEQLFEKLFASMLQGPWHKNTHAHTLESSSEHLKAGSKAILHQKHFVLTLANKWMVIFYKQQKFCNIFLFFPFTLCLFPKFVFCCVFVFCCLVFFFNLMCSLSTKAKSNRKLHSQHQSGTEPGYVNRFVVPKFLEERRKKFLLLKLGPHPYVSIVFFYLYNQRQSHFVQYLKQQDPVILLLH